jgi:hypothetical protein
VPSGIRSGRGVSLGRRWAVRSWRLQRWGRSDSRTFGFVRKKAARADAESSAFEASQTLTGETRVLDRRAWAQHALLMTSSLDDAGARDRSIGDTARARAYYRDFLPGIGAYLLVLAAVLAWGHLDGTGPARWAWALAPVLPAAWIVRAVVRHLHRLDDYQRLLQLQGLGVGFAVAMLSAVTVGFLGIAGLPAMAAGWIVFAVGMAAWLVAATIASNR